MPKLKAKDPNVTAEDPLSIKPFTSETSPISLNFTDEAPSRWFQSFGFDGVRATREEVGGAAWDKADTGLQSIMNMRELNRAEEVTKYSDEELRSLYGKRSSDARGGGANFAKNRPTLDEFGVSERPVYLSPDEANQQYGIPGHLTWDKPISSLVASIQHKRKLDEVKYSNIVGRAQGFVDNGMALGIEMGASLLDPVGLAIGFIPIIGEARYAKLAESGFKTASRMLRGAEAGFVGSLGVEPFIYADKVQSKADYDMYDSLANVAFGTVAGGGLFVVGGKIADGVRGLRKESHVKAFDLSVKQLASGKNVEVGPIATHGAGNGKSTVVNIDDFDPTPGVTSGKGIEPPAELDPELKKLSPIKEYPPAADVGKSLELMDKVTTGPTNRITAQQIQKAVDTPALKEAVEQAAKMNLGNNVAFYITTADGNVVAVKAGKEQRLNGAPMSLITSPAYKSGGVIDMNTVTSTLQDLLAVHGLSGDDGMSMAYKGSYKLDKGNITHIIEINKAAFDPLQNQHNIVIAPFDNMKGMFSQDPADQVFSDLNPRGKEGVLATAQTLKSFVADDTPMKYKSFGGFDETLDVTQLKSTGPQQGTNPGGMHKDQVTGADLYVKYQDTNQAMNEWMAATLYRWFSVPLPKTTIVTDAGKTIGVASEVIYQGKTLSPDEFAKLDPTVQREFLRHFMVDAFLGNWDVVGNGPNWNMMLMPSGEVIRIDPGGALLYRAQGKPKGKDFAPTVTEFNSLQNSAMNPAAAKVFKLAKSVDDIDDAVYRILRVPESELIKLVDSAKQHGLGETEAKVLLETLLARRLDLQNTYGEAAKRAAKDQNKVQFTSQSEALDFLKTTKDATLKHINKDEINVVKQYTGSYYKNLNDALWQQHSNGTPISSGLQKDIDLLDSAIAKSPKLTEAIELWRGNIGHNAFNSLLAEAGLSTFGKGAKINGEDAYNILKALEGKTIELPGFTSTSLNYQFAKNWHGAYQGISSIAQIIVPEGQQALMVGPHLGLQTEFEVLLPRGSKYRLVQVLPPKGTGGDPTLLLQVVDKNSHLPFEKPSGDMLKTAKQWKESGSNSADTTPIAGEPIDAVGDTLKGGMDDLAKVTQELEDLQTSLDSQMANLDPTVMKALEKDLKAINEQADIAAAEAQNMYKAAQAAAVCINKG
jgi:hypothetical protein